MGVVVTLICESATWVFDAMALSVDYYCTFFVPSPNGFFATVAVVPIYSFIVNPQGGRPLLVEVGSLALLCSR